LHGGCWSLAPEHKRKPRTQPGSPGLRLTQTLWVPSGARFAPSGMLGRHLRLLRRRPPSRTNAVLLRRSAGSFCWVEGELEGVGSGQPLANAPGTSKLGRRGSARGWGVGTPSHLLGSMEASVEGSLKRKRCFYAPGMHHVKEASSENVVFAPLGSMI